ncbi:MAG: hypothetical protein AAGF12_25000 [Myxococcota bacterium]
MVLISAGVLLYLGWYLGVRRPAGGDLDSAVADLEALRADPEVQTALLHRHQRRDGYESAAPVRCLRYGHASPEEVEAAVHALRALDLAENYPTLLGWFEHWKGLESARYHSEDGRTELVAAVSEVHGWRRAAIFELRLERLMSELDRVVAASGVDTGPTGPAPRGLEGLYRDHALALSTAALSVIAGYQREKTLGLLQDVEAALRAHATDHGSLPPDLASLPSLEAAPSDVYLDYLRLSDYQAEIHTFLPTSESGEGLDFERSTFLITVGSTREAQSPQPSGQEGLTR